MSTNVPERLLGALVYATTMSVASRVRAQLGNSLAATGSHATVRETKLHISLHFAMKIRNYCDEA